MWSNNWIILNKNNFKIINAMKQPKKNTIDEFRKEWILQCTRFERILIYFRIVQLKITDTNYNKTNSDYYLEDRLNPLNPFAYFIILFLIIRGVFTFELDYKNFLSNMRNAFKWNKV
jgi:hypothetical protein